MRRDAAIFAARQERFGRAQEFAPDRCHVRIGDLDGLVIRALAKAHARSQRNRALDVLRSAAQIRLQDDADVVVTREGAFEYAQRRVGDARAFHIDPHERVGQRGSAREDLLEVAQAHLFVDQQPERRQLHRNVGARTGTFDRGERREVDVTRLLRLLGADDVLAEKIERSTQPFGIQRGNRSERRVDGFAGHEAFREKEKAPLEG